MLVNDSTLACASSMQCALPGAMLRGTNSAFFCNSTGTSLCTRLIQLLLCVFFLSVLVLTVQTASVCALTAVIPTFMTARAPHAHARAKRLLCVPWYPSRSIYIVYATKSLHHHLLAPILSLDEHCSEVRLELETPTGFFPVVTTLFSFPDGDSCCVYRTSRVCINIWK